MNGGNKFFEMKNLDFILTSWAIYTIVLLKQFRTKVEMENNYVANYVNAC